MNHVSQTVGTGQIHLQPAANIPLLSTNTQPAPGSAFLTALSVSIMQLPLVSKLELDMMVLFACPYPVAERGPGEPERGGGAGARV